MVRGVTNELPLAGSGNPLGNLASLSQCRVEHIGRATPNTGFLHSSIIGKVGLGKQLQGSKSMVRGRHSIINVTSMFYREPPKFNISFVGPHDHAV